MAVVIAGPSLLAGVLLGIGASSSPASWWSWSALALATLALCTKCSQGTRLIALLVIGIALATFSTRQWQELHIPPDSGDTRLLLEGTVSGVPARDGAELRFDAQVRVVGGKSDADARLRHARLVWREPPVVPRAGERWRWLVRPSGGIVTRNFDGFDAARSVFRDRIHLTGRVVPAALTSRLSLADASVDTWRARIATRIADHVVDPEAAALMTALAVGITAGMSTDQWRVFNATGTTHLVAISGLHVTLFATVMFFLARWLWRFLPFAHRLPREPFSLLLGVLAAGGYTLLAGFSVPAQRTWLMLSIFALTRLSARHVGAGHTWSLAMVGVLLFDVLAPLESGFWLSFIAVGVILMFATTSLVPVRPARQLLDLQLAVTLALAPLTFGVFGSVSLVGLAVNLLAIPAISLVFVPLVLAGALAALVWPLACQPLFALVAYLHDWLWPALVWAASLEIAVWRFQPPAWWYAISLPAALLLLSCWPKELRIAGICLLLPLLFAPSRLPPPGSARVLVLDAGRGSAALVTTHHNVLLFDTGDAWNTRGSRAARVVLPALDALAVRRIDQLILPRLDGDRAHGAALLAHEREVTEVIAGGGWPGTTLSARRCRDQDFARDGVDFEIFAAGAGGCVLRVSVGGHAMFFAGDLDAAAELQLLARFPPSALTSEVLLLSRGAGARASGRQWIEASGVRLAIAAGGQAGTATRARTLERWQDADVRVIDVLREGAVEIGLDVHGFAVLATARSARYPFAWRR